MKSILITGISGFVGGYYTRYVLNTKKDVTVHGISRSVPSWDFIENRNEMVNSIHFHPCDLLDASLVTAIIEEIHPDYILHLASFSLPLGRAGKNHGCPL